MRYLDREIFWFAYNILYNLANILWDLISSCEPTEDLWFKISDEILAEILTRGIFFLVYLLRRLLLQDGLENGLQLALHHIHVQSECSQVVELLGPIALGTVVQVIVEYVVQWVDPDILRSLGLIGSCLLRRFLIGFLKKVHYN